MGRQGFVPAAPAEEEITVPPEIAEKAARLAARWGERIESIVYFAHPVTGHGILVVARERGEPFLDLLAHVYGVLSGGLGIHCLRRDELFELALPGFPFPGLSVDDQPFLACCAKFSSAVLAGVDVRPEIPLPARPEIFLGVEIRACREYFRTHVVLELLARSEHRRLLGEIAREARYLLSLALLAAGEWQVAGEEVAGRFAARSRNAPAFATWEKLRCLAEPPEGAEPEDLQAAAEEGSWLFERLLRQLADAAP